MNTIKYTVIFIFWAFILSACSDSSIKKVDIKPEKIDNETKHLIEYFEKGANYINSRKAPAIVLATDVYANIGNYLIIDMRSHNAYVNGHINTAVNVPSKNLFSYLNDSISAAAYDKIVLVCYSGQEASYATGILRLAGFGNVYALKFGMSSWNKDYADIKWFKRISNKYASKLDKLSHDKGEKTEDNLPQINTGAPTAMGIAIARAKELLEKGDAGIYVRPDTVFANPDKYYIVSYVTKDIYDMGHLPGAVNYSPRKSLAWNTDLLTLPKDKQIVINCYTGLHASQVVAFLRMLGYDAYILSFGMNSYMHDAMKNIPAMASKAFSKVNVMDYDVIEGENPTDKAINVSSTAQQKQQKPVITVKRKKKDDDTGGC